MEILKANANDAGQRLDKFLSKRYKSMPQSLLYKYIRTKRIKLNGKRAKENRLLADGDEITLYIPDEFTGGSRRDEVAKKQNRRQDAGNFLSHEMGILLV